MAEPLSAFDKARTRWGWGTSSDPAERQRFAQAGLSPLTSEERMRMERGWGASPLASKESREAMVAEEVRRGDRPASQLPEAYGGRPTGQSRRAMRMQAAWDEAQKQQREQQRMAQQMEMESRRIALQEKDQFIQEQEYGRKIKEYEAQQDIKGQTEIESNKILDWLGGRAKDKDGNIIPKPDPKSENFQFGLADVLADNPLGASALEQVISPYVNINKIYIENRPKGLTGKEQEDVAMVSEQTGLPMSNFINTDTKTGLDVVDYEALGRAKGTLRTREEEEPTYGGKTERSIESIVTAISADIVEAETARDPSKVESLKAKKSYYENLVPKDNVENAAKPSNIPAPDKRKKGEVYDTPRGKLKWTGTGWVTP
jgi:hypothetical protein